jgi:hypothetical protein
VEDAGAGLRVPGVETGREERPREVGRKHLPHDVVEGFGLGLSLALPAFRLTLYEALGPAVGAEVDAVPRLDQQAVYDRQ